MRETIAHLINRMLKGVGLKTLDRQFLFSYALIFIFAAVSVISLFLSMGTDASSINMAGAQRMLSQRVAKEAMLVGSGVEQRSAAEKTIQLFERSHNALMKGDKARGIAAVKDEKIRAQLSKVEQLWREYKQSISNHMTTPTAETLRAIQAQSPVVLKEMNKGVGMMAELSNSIARFQQRLAVGTTSAILLLVIFGRMFGMTVLMREIRNLQAHLEMVSKGDYTHRMDVADGDNEIGQIVSAYNNMLVQTDEMIQEVARVSTRVTHDNEKVQVNLNETEMGVRQQHSEIGRAHV